MWDISLMDFLLISLASFRLTRLIVFDKITEFIRAPFFDDIEEINFNGEKEIYYYPKQTLIKGFFGNLFSCYWCTGIWTSIFTCIIYLLWPFYAFPFLLIFAVAGFAALIEATIQRWIE